MTRGPMPMLCCIPNRINQEFGDRFNRINQEPWDHLHRVNQEPWDRLCGDRRLSWAPSFQIRGVAGSGFLHRLCFRNGGVCYITLTCKMLPSFSAIIRDQAFRFQSLARLAS